MSKSKDKKKKQQAKSAKVLHPELEDLVALGICLVSILAVWFILDPQMGTTLLSGNDAIMLLPRLFDILHFTASDIFYRADVMGGVAVADVLGKLPIYDLAGLLGISVPWAHNIAVILMQTLFSFMGVKATFALAKIWGHEARLDKMSIIGLCLLFAFLPILGSRVQYGHLDLLFGFLFFMVGASSILCWKAREFSWTLGVVILIAVWHAIPSHGHQLKLYSVIFGLPIIIGALINKPIKEVVSEIKALKWSGIGLLAILLGSFAFAFPRFYGMLKYVGSTDTLRSIDGEPAIYSYAPTEFFNYVASFLWDYKILAKTDSTLFISAFYFPIGCLVLFALLLRGQKLFLAGGLFLSLISSIFLALKVQPFNELMMAIVPTLDSFRVPERSIMPFCAAIPIVAAAMLITHFKRPFRKGSLFWVVGIGVLAYFSGGIFRELIFWSFAGLMAYHILKKESPQGVSAASILLVFAVGSVLAFNNWRTPRLKASTQIENLQKAGEQIRNQASHLKSPLHRCYFEFLSTPFNVHASVLMGISTPSGYWAPQKRFVDLLGALEKKAYPKESVYFDVKENLPSAPVLKSMYNISCKIKKESGNEVRFVALGEPQAPLWSSGGIFFVDDMEVVGRLLNRNKDNAREYMKSTLLVNKSDPLFSRAERAVESKNFDGCLNGSSSEPSVSEDGQSFSMTVNLPKDCPITLAMNFSENLKAYAQDDAGKEIELVTFPSYGSLVSVVAPKGKQKIRIGAVAWDSPVAAMMGPLGFILFLVGMFMVRRED